MSTGLHRIELTRFACLGGPVRRWPVGAAGHSRPGYLGWGVAGLLAILTAGAALTLANWSPPASHGVNAAGGVTNGGGAIRLVSGAAAAPEPAPAIATPPTLADASLYPDTAPLDATAAEGLRISSQHWRRGGLGSNALVTFTLRNSNDYAVKDIEITCAFSRRDGSHLTDRTRVIHDTVATKGRKTFARLHIGFVNINADRAKCAPVAASRI